MKSIKVKLKEKNSDDKLAEITENAYEYAKLSYEQEEKREESLVQQATQMTTYFSFVSVLVLMAIPLLVGENSTIPRTYTVSISIISLLMLFASMVLAVIVQWRFNYQALPSPTTIFSHIISNKEYFQTAEQRNKSFIQTLESTWKSKHTINDKRARLIRASMTIFLIAIAFLIAAVVFAILAFVI